MMCVGNFQSADTLYIVKAFFDCLRFFISSNTIKKDIAASPLIPLRLS